MPPQTSESRSPKSAQEKSTAHFLNPKSAKKLAQKLAPKAPAQPQQKYASLEYQAKILAQKPKVKLLDPKSLSKRLFDSSIFSRLRLSYTRLPRFVKILVPLIPISGFFTQNVAQLMWIRGPSMTPYLNENYDQDHTKSDFVLVNQWSWGLWSQRVLERGMVVTFRSPSDPTKIAVKRVVGLPGDRIHTREPCLKPSQIVPFNHVWLEGDAEDPKTTIDSNTYGPVSISLISGRVLAVLGPRWRWLNWRDWDEDKPEYTYRKSVRDRVVKNAVVLGEPELGRKF
ncbi:hypothetical protein N7495_009327 [Penicillium taxi]|uniref:uncharacterized protein n=1 Tax=Penicillium taxi TaxID=168475 RepID=UPI0025454A4E|nr:uncharacterized protein N7495_009327 [Penicillium taxi]KAJ5884817.1 hypothetical protein N7495_009327 [Penicillium taxi]